MNENIEQKVLKLEPRTSTRNHTFNIIFQLEFFTTNEIKEILSKYYETLEYEKDLELKENENFLPYEINKKIIEEQIFNLIENIDKIDEIIQENSIGWSIKRLDKVDLAILRLAIFEILFEEQIPNKVVINEAIELAKEYGNEKSYKFINGVLATVEKGN